MIGSNCPEPIQSVIREWMADLQLAPESLVAIESPDALLIEVSEIGLYHSDLTYEQSRRAVAALRRRLATTSEQKELVVRIVKYDGPLLEIESTLQTALSAKLGDAFVSIMLMDLKPPHVSAVVELNISSASFQGTWQQAKETVSDRLQEHRLQLARFQLRQEGWPVPQKLAILTSVKVIQPALVDDLERYLLLREFNVESSKWLSHQLDALRKDELVLRSKVDHRYRLTRAGVLLLVGSKRRSSSDVLRALALGRRRW